MKAKLALLMFLLASISNADLVSVSGTHGMVTSRSVLASNIGVKIMKAGGNAVDSAVATAFALAVTYPSAGNIGGGGFALVRLSDGNVVALDHREKAPKTAHRDMYLDRLGNIIDKLSTQSHLASGVPGSVDGLLRLLDAHGTMSRKQVMLPAIDLARNGFPLTFDLVQQFKTVLPKMKAYPASLAKFSKNGKPYEVGDIWHQPDLAKTLRGIMQNGRSGFYEGEVASLIVREMDRNNGRISSADLTEYRSVWRTPVSGSYRGYKVWGMGPPSSGGILVIQMLNMLEPFDLRSMGYGSASSIHHIVEASRRAYADRAEYFGDPDYYPVPIGMLLDKQYANQRFADFDLGKASLSEDIDPGVWSRESPETTHFSVIDSNGIMVSFTTTLNSSYGNKIVVPGTGVLLNNEMDDFSVKKDIPNQYRLIGREANAIEPGKRMLSSMSPTIVTKDGSPFLITGSQGGSRIITTVLQVIINVIDHGMQLGDAVTLPRIHHQWLPDQIVHDSFAISPDTRHRLNALGHKNIVESKNGIGDANSILVQGKAIFGIKDPRAEGAAVGY